MKEYPTDERGQLDAGAQRDSRERPCAKQCLDRWGNATWCTQRDRHEGACSDGR